MDKQEYLSLHGLYREIADFLGEDLQNTAYDDLVGPIDISASKEDHKEALYMISGHLGNKFEDISAPEWEYERGVQAPDVVSGDIALHRRPRKRYDTIVINYGGEESVKIRLAETGRYSHIHQSLWDFAEGCDLDEALQANYKEPGRRGRRFPYSEFDEDDVDEEDLECILEESKA